MTAGALGAVRGAPPRQGAAPRARRWPERLRGCAGDPALWAWGLVALVALLPLRGWL